MNRTKHRKHDHTSFTPPWWCRNRHLQTTLPLLIKPRREHPLTWETMQTPDHDFIDVSIAGEEQEGTIILFSGLEGSVNSAYATIIINTMVPRGWRVIMPHHKGCGPSGHNKQAQTYHAGFTDDFYFSLKQIGACKRRFIIGVSLGSSIMLNALANDPNIAIDGAIGISTPFDLTRCSQAMPWYYQRLLLKSMRDKMRAKLAKGITLPIQEKQLKRLSTLRDFDHALVATLHHFKDAEDYYQQASCRQRLTKIQQPCVLIQAKDDPFVPEDALPTQQQLGPNMHLNLSQHGGHVGFVSFSPHINPHYWLGTRVNEIITNMSTSVIQT
jgi:predicted alpha/beta-fold hydrolase